MSRTLARIAGTALAGLWLTWAAHAAQYDAHIERIKDGDTIAAVVEIWPQILATVTVDGRVVQITANTALRLSGLNTPESNPSAAAKLCASAADPKGCKHCEMRAGLRAKQALAGLIQGAQCVVQDPDPAASKYAGRVGGALVCNGVDVGAQLLADGLALPYGGDARTPWQGCAP